MDFLETLGTMLVLLFLIGIALILVAGWVAFCIAVLIKVMDVIRDWWIVWRILVYIGWAHLLLGAPCALLSLRS